MRPFFPFYGGKWRDAPQLYPPPCHRTIVEPFAGSAGYAVRHAGREVVLCDIEPTIAGVWSYLVRVSPREILRIPDIRDDETVDDLGPLPEEAKSLVGFWLNRSSSPRRSPSKWMREGVRPGSFWGERTRQTIASQVDGIRHWRILNCAYGDCPVTKTATWLIDPPYQEAGKHYKFGSARIDYDDLGTWCRGRRGQVIVSEAEGAEWLPFRATASTRTARNTRSREVTWIRSSGRSMRSDRAHGSPAAKLTNRGNG